MDKKEVVVVVPVYRPELTVWERALSLIHI